MSSDKGITAPTNVVKPISDQPSASQSSENADHTTPANSIFLPPGAPSELIAALSKETEPIDQFTEPFGTLNKYGETILFESAVRICSTQHTRISTQISSSGGTVTIIFYSEKCKVFVIVTDKEKIWPRVTKELLKDTKLENDGWAVDSCSKIASFKNSPLVTSTNLFEIGNNSLIEFDSKEKLIEFKNVMRNVKVRISRNRLPTTDLPMEGYARLISEFWFQTRLRQCDLKVVFIWEGNIWRIEPSRPAVLKLGIFALVQSKANASLQIITLFNDEKTAYKVPTHFELLVSDISPNKNKFVWEWFVSDDESDERNACEFDTAKLASDFKTTVNYYVDTWKKNKLSWSW